MLREAARFLARDLSRVYALLRSGDLVAVPDDPNDTRGGVLVDRSSLDGY